jgi:hypothetical protein
LCSTSQREEKVHKIFAWLNFVAMSFVGVKG